jgi:predicted  nucleic acid-binding Zn-ribbon protein
MKEIMQHLFELQALEFDITVRMDNEKRIAALRALVPAPILAHYDRLADQGKKGVALVRNQTCSGCHMRVPLGMIMNLRHDQDICLCDNCRRYLFLREDVLPTGQPTVEKPAAKPTAKAGRNKPALQTA